MTQVQIDEFKKELAALLTKYSVHIGCIYEGDTHGIYNEYMYVQENKTQTEVLRVELQSYIDASDLK